MSSRRKLTPRASARATMFAILYGACGAVANAATPVDASAGTSGAVTPQPAARSASGSFVAQPVAPAASAAIIVPPAQAVHRPAKRWVQRPIIIENGPKRKLAVGEVRSIELQSVARIAVGNGAVVKATVVDDRQIVLLAESEGETTMHVWLKDGRQITYDIEVTSYQVTSYRTELQLDEVQSLIADMNGVRARMVGNRVVLEGRYPNPEASDRIDVLVKNFPSILNLIPAVPSDVDRMQSERMIQLDLRIIEVKKSALDQLGIKWANTANGPTFMTNALGYSNTPYRPADNAGFPPVTTGHPISTFLGLATSITSALSFLEQNGDAWTLSEPHLSCKSGGSSKFLAGGEIPIPVAQAFGAVSVVYKNYGIVIEFKPKADAVGNIVSSISAEVSEPDTRNSQAGFVAFTTNRADTEVAIRENEPLVIAGLSRQVVSRSNDAIPGLGRIPLLGALFGAKDNSFERTEVIIVVTPHIVEIKGQANVDAVEKSRVDAADISKMSDTRLKENRP